MMCIYDVAADPGCPCERSDCGFCGGIAGEACKGFTQARIRLCPPSSLRAGQVNFGRHRYFLRLTGPGYGEIPGRSEEHTSELQSLMRTSYAVFCLQKKKIHSTTNLTHELLHH